MFLQDTPDTSGYMILGFALSFVVMGIYAFSLYLRARNAQSDIETLEAISGDKKSKPAAKKPAPAKKKK